MKEPTPVSIPISISDAEWEVMRALWAGPVPMAAAEVIGRLGGRDWDPVTIRTMLGRLVKKGAITFEPDGKRYLYKPAVSQQRCVRARSKSFLKRVFAGAAGPMIAKLVEEARLSDREIDELTEILKRKRGKR